MDKNKPGPGCCGTMPLLFYLGLGDLTRDRVTGNMELSVAGLASLNLGRSEIL